MDNASTDVLSVGVASMKDTSICVTPMSVASVKAMPSTDVPITDVSI